MHLELNVHISEFSFVFRAEEEQSYSLQPYQHVQLKFQQYR